MTQALPGIWFAKKKNIPCYLYVQDLWPENVEIITGIKSELIIEPITKMVKYIYRNSDKIFTTSKSFVESIIDRGVNREKVGYWPQYAEDFYKPIEDDFETEIPNDDKINFVFAGNIGEAQGLEILPKVAEKLINTDLEKKIRFNIIGDGRYKDELIRLTKKLDNNEMFNFIERKPAKEIPKYMAVSDVAFLSLNDHPLFSKTIPAKLQSYMACGMPIIASATGETENIISEANAGYSCKPGDVECLKEIIGKISYLDEERLKELSVNSRKFYEDNFNKTKLLDYMEGIIQK